MDIYAMYLRKSRSDEQAEARGEGDVLTRHRKTLSELAAYNGHTIVAEYAEVASGDSLATRPQAQRLLLDVMAGKYTGVYCMALDRLSRGAAEDQAAVIRAFQSSGTLIITPEKVYDFNQAADEDFGELRLMFSRIEHKTIKRRMYAGRERSARDGWYIGARIPFGYSKVPAQGKNGPTLAVIPEQAEIVRDIFQMYADGKSSHFIADELNRRGVKPNYSEVWSPSTVRNMLKNPLYIGKISWGKRVARPTLEGGKKRVVNARAIYADGRHEAIVSEALWDAVQARLAGNSAPPVKAGNALQNPLAGLLYCARCGYGMQRHNGTSANSKYYRPDSVKCYNRTCHQMRADLDVVEGMILQHIEDYFAEALQPGKLATRHNQERQKAAKLIRDQIKQAEAQQSRQADLLEQGVYSVEDFIARRNALSERLLELRRRLAEAEAPDMYEERLADLRQFVPRSMSITEAYRRAPDNETRNALLSTVIERVEYDKTEKRHGRFDDRERGISLTFKMLF